jgi:hypothetical protein
VIDTRRRQACNMRFPPKNFPTGRCRGWIAAILAAKIAGAFAAPASKNITILVPEGTSTHGQPDLLCQPATWTHVLSFLFLNYCIHAATVLIPPHLSSLLRSWSGSTQNRLGIPRQSSRCVCTWVPQASRRLHTCPSSKRYGADTIEGCRQPRCCFRRERPSQMESLSTPLGDVAFP